MSGDLPKIPHAYLLAMYRHARREFPKECCGYLLGEGDEAELVTCENVQDRLHAQDPEMFQRTSETAYSLGGKELLRFIHSFDGPKRATVLYHSHPRVGAYFSEEDTRGALAAAYPVDYLVIDVQEDEIREAKLFRQDGDGFREVACLAGAKL